jgi:hypothetical protein
MIVFLLRIGFPAALLYVMKLARDNARVAPDTGDLTNAYYVALSVSLAIGLAIVWAPFVGGKLADPLAGVYTEGAFAEQRRRLLRLCRWLETRGWRRLATWFCFLEGVNHPWLPTAFVIGLRNARPGSWLEKVYAKEVFKFDNAQHCLRAYDALRRHGIDPGPHHRGDVNLLLRGHQRVVRPDPEPVALPPAPPPPAPKRNPRIRLFAAADRRIAEGTATDPWEPQREAADETATNPARRFRSWTSAGPT